MKILNVPSVKNQGFKSGTAEKKLSSKTSKSKANNKKIILALAGLASVALAGIAIYKHKGIQKSTVANNVAEKAKNKVDSLLQESKLISIEIDEAKDKSFKMLQKAEESLGVCGKFTPGLSAQNICSQATYEGAQVKIGNNEFIAKKLNDGSERTIITIIKDNMSVLVDKNGSIETIKSQGDKLYVTNNQQHLLCKDYVSNNGVKKASKIFDIYDPVMQSVYTNVETLKGTDITRYNGTKFEKFYSFWGLSNDNRMLSQYWEKFNPENLADSSKNVQYWPFDTEIISKL